MSVVVVVDVMLAAVLAVADVVSVVVFFCVVSLFFPSRDGGCRCRCFCFHFVIAGIVAVGVTELALASDLAIVIVVLDPVACCHYWWVS